MNILISFFIFYSEHKENNLYAKFKMFDLRQSQNELIFLYGVNTYAVRCMNLSFWVLLDKDMDF